MLQSLNLYLGVFVINLKMIHSKYFKTSNFHDQSYLMQSFVTFKVFPFVRLAEQTQRLDLNKTFGLLKCDIQKLYSYNNLIHFK